MRIALTGGTGFVGGHVLRLAIARGWQVKALARSDQPPHRGVWWVKGALDRPEALARLVEGTEAVIHVAGVVNAPDRAGFAAGNIAGTQAMLAAAEAAGVRRFVHVSSLAAREPGLSDYGWSKTEAERAVAAAPLDWAMVRPPAVYGPGDREMLDLFRLARRGLIALPPPGRLSVIAAEDLARLLLVLAEGGPSRVTYEPDDGVSGGWTHGEFARALGEAVGRRVRAFNVPAPLLRLGSRLDRAVRGKGAKLTADRVRYFCHPDWVAKAEQHPPVALWHAEIPTPTGLRQTADWYREKGWL